MMHTAPDRLDDHRDESGVCVLLERFCSEWRNLACQFAFNLRPLEARRTSTPTSLEERHKLDESVSKLEQSLCAVQIETSTTATATSTRRYCFDALLDHFIGAPQNENRRRKLSRGATMATTANWMLRGRSITKRASARAEALSCSEAKPTAQLSNQYRWSRLSSKRTP
jgi:hypothetical protein